MSSARFRVAAALVAVVAGAGVLNAQAASASSLVLALKTDYTLEVQVSNGLRIGVSTRGATIPPGVYDAVVISEVPEAQDDYHMFHLVGPGVNLQTDLLAGDERAEPHVVTLQPNSVYSFRDERDLSLGSVVFSTSGSGTETARASGGTSSGGSAPAGAPTPRVENRDPVGSRALPARGALAGSVTTAGKLSLSFKGKQVSSLRAGRYRLSVLDETSRSAFMLQRVKQSPLTVSTKAHVGRRTVTVTLAAGQWSFYSSPAKRSYFVVLAR
jgi:hypothetical protein